MDNVQTTKALIVLPRLRVQALNATSSALTVGFPSPLAVYGLTGALERKLIEAGEAVRMLRFGVVSHNFELLSQEGDYGATRPRLQKNSKDDGSTGSASVQESYFAHATLSLVFEADVPSTVFSEGQAAAVAMRILNVMQTLRVAGGAVLPRDPRDRRTLPLVVPAPDPIVGSSGAEGRLPAAVTRAVLPGFALVDRSDLLPPDASSLTPVARLASVMSWSAWPAAKRKPRVPTKKEKPRDAPTIDGLSGAELQQEMLDNSPGCQADRPAWVVPMPVGYLAITEAVSHLRGARLPGVPAMAVETLLGLAQFKSAHRVDMSELLWSGCAVPTGDSRAPWLCICEGTPPSVP